MTLRPQSWSSTLPEERPLELYKCEAEVCLSDGVVLEGERKGSGKARLEEGSDMSAGWLITTRAYLIVHATAQVCPTVSNVVIWTGGA
jgi:hypothetical protein